MLLIRYISMFLLECYKQAFIQQRALLESMSDRAKLTQRPSYR